MVKILNSDFRRELYTNLIDAGYDKEEAQKIVGIKYSIALKNHLIDKLREEAEAIEKNDRELKLSVAEYENMLNELSKMEDFFKEKEKK